MRSVQTLIAEASAIVGSQAELARRLRVTPQRVHEWKTGARPMTPELVGQLADVIGLAGDEARRLAALAVIEHPKNAGLRQTLRRAFFVCWVTGAATLGTQDHPEKETTTTDEASLTEYTLSRVAAWLRRCMRRLSRTGTAPEHRTRDAPYCRPALYLSGLGPRS